MLDGGIMSTVIDVCVTVTSWTLNNTCLQINKTVTVQETVVYLQRRVSHEKNSTEGFGERSFASFLLLCLSISTYDGMFEYISSICVRQSSVGVLTISTKDGRSSTTYTTQKLYYADSY